MVEITLPIVLQIVQTLGILVGIIYYITIMRNSYKAQQMTLDATRTQVFLQMYGAITPELIERVHEVIGWEFTDIEDFESKYGERHYAQWESVLQRYNGIGLLAKQNQLDLDLIHKLLILPILGLWRNFEGVIKHRRALYDAPDLYEGVEYLYNEMMKRRQEFTLPET
jgi:hypothetical protein